MSRTLKGTAVVLAGFLILAAALLGRHPETAVPGRPPNRPAPSRGADPSTVDEDRPAMALQLRNAEGELLRLCEQRDQLLRRKKELEQATIVPPGTLNDQMSAAADEHYREAERWYQAGVLDRAEAECRKAIEILPDHLAARALLTEIRFAAGKRTGTPSAPR